MFEGLFIIIWTLLYEACSLLTWLMQCIYETFEIFAGLRRVRYNGEDKFLIDVFFEMMLFQEFTLEWRQLELYYALHLLLSLLFVKCLIQKIKCRQLLVVLSEI